MLLQGKVALVAGVGPGLGAEAALALADHGADIVIAARKSDFLEELAQKIQNMGRRVTWLSVDVTDPAACIRLVDSVRAEHGSLDIVVYNAFYLGPLGSVLDTDLDEWRRVLDVNLLGCLTLLRATIPLLEASGSIVVVNSLQAWKVISGFGAYSASKAALESVTRALAAELGPRSIRVNGIHPGMIMAESLKTHFEQEAKTLGCSYKETYAKYASEAVMNIIPSAREVAGTVVYLASDLASPVTGQSIGINAGAWFH